MIHILHSLYILSPLLIVSFYKGKFRYQIILLFVFVSILIYTPKLFGFEFIIEILRISNFNFCFFIFLTLLSFLLLKENLLKTAKYLSLALVIILLTNHWKGYFYRQDITIAKNDSHIYITRIEYRPFGEIYQDLFMSKYNFLFYKNIHNAYYDDKTDHENIYIIDKDSRKEFYVDVKNEKLILIRKW